MRGFFILVAGLGLLSSLLSSGPSRTGDSESGVLRDAQASQDSEIAKLKAQNAAQFTSNEGTVELTRGPDGHFYADVRINGSYVHMLVDTGASVIALSRDDARTAGLATSIAMNDVIGKGADGAVHGEYAKLDRVELGPLSAEGLEAVVLSNGEQSLLGQSFLSKFASVQIEGDRMLLR